MYGILDFSNFLYLPHITQYQYFHLSLLVIGNNVVLFYHSFYIRLKEIILHNPSNFHLKCIKSISPLQKCSHIIRSNACNLINIFYDIFDFYEFLNFFWNMFQSRIIEICFYDSNIEISSEFSIDLNSSKFVTYGLSFILGKLLLELTPLNLRSL